MVDKQMTDEQITNHMAENVMGLERKSNCWMIVENDEVKNIVLNHEFNPLYELNHAFGALEKWRENNNGNKNYKIEAAWNGFKKVTLYDGFCGEWLNNTKTDKSLARAICLALVEATKEAK